MNKYLNLVLILLVTIGSIWYVPKVSDFIVSKIINNKETNIFSTGNTVEIKIQTGVIETEYDLFWKLVEKGNSTKFYPKIPKKTTTTECNSTLNAYIKNNNYSFKTPKSLATGYLYIKFNEVGKTLPQPPVFLYFHNTNEGGFPVSGYPNGDYSISTPTKGEYLFNLKDIALVRFHNKELKSFDWSQYFNGGEQYIGGYVRECDGSNIESIIIARE